MKLAVVITAGGRAPKCEFAAGFDGLDYAPEAVENDSLIKALLRVGGVTLLERVWQAVHGCPQVEQVVLVGSARLRTWAQEREVKWIAELSEAHENLLVGLQAVAQFPRVVYLSSDLPFITDAAVFRFIQACPAEAQFCYAIVRREVFDTRFPASPSTYARLKDGEFAAGNAILMDPAAMLRQAEWMRRVARNRKNLWKIAALAGPAMLWKFMTRQLTVADVEHRASRLLKLRCRAVECEPELAYDIDTAQDYQHAMRLVYGQPR